MKLNKFPNFIQPDTMACGATCLQIISSYYGREYDIDYLLSITSTSREGTSMFGISEAAEKIGFKTLGAKVSYSQLQESESFPCIAYWNNLHFIVIYKIKSDIVYVSDPAFGLIKYTKAEFSKYWLQDEDNEGIILFIEKTPAFNLNKSNDDFVTKRKGFRFLYKYLFVYKSYLIQLFIGLFIGSILQLIFPFLTQSVVDIGIQNQDLNFIYLVLLAQLFLFLGRMIVDIINNLIMIHISSRINMALLSSFFSKLLRLPISFFDVKLTGDLLQRINDNTRIEQFLTGTSISTLFYLFNFVMFLTVLALYNIIVFVVFLAGSVLYFAWITYFLKIRAEIDYKLFHQHSQNQSLVIELINGMQEIKLNGAERKKRWQWERRQVKLFTINIKSLNVTQIQNTGALMINELKNIFITFLSAKLVLNGDISLGMMLSISYIIGQLNTPILEFVSFIQNWQNANLSLSRLEDIHNMKDEESDVNNAFDNDIQCGAITLKHVSFRYPGINSKLLFDNLNLEIPANKITAIVGSSGSGKTTLLKLVLKFYTPERGEINLGSKPLRDISSEFWRRKCGCVMQDGYIFSDTISNNIAISEDNIDLQKLKYATEIANIEDYVKNLPLNYNTKIGMEGLGLSVGQKQRILIARAVYKNPDYLFFDEATSSLDANNEKTIMNNLNSFFKNKTVLIIAHRLSTVKSADKIIVLESGKIIEEGNHEELVKLRGAYYELIKNQLELGA